MIYLTDKNVGVILLLLETIIIIEAFEIHGGYKLFSHLNPNMFSVECAKTVWELAVCTEFFSRFHEVGDCRPF